MCTGKLIVKMKREIPLFIVDSSRKHKKGECDYICCTDKDSGFIAKIDYIDGEIEETGSDYRIGLSKNGISCRMKIVRAMGENPTEQLLEVCSKKEWSIIQPSFKKMLMSQGLAEKIALIALM